MQYDDLDTAGVPRKLAFTDLMLDQDLGTVPTIEFEALFEEALRKRDPKLIRVSCEALLDRHPAHTRALTLWAETSLRSGRFDQVETRLWDALARSPDDIPARELLARVYEAQGNMDATRAVYREIADLCELRGDHERATYIRQRWVNVFELGEPDTAPSITITLREVARDSTSSIALVDLADPSRGRLIL